MNDLVSLHGDHVSLRGDRVSLHGDHMQLRVLLQSFLLISRRLTSPRVALRSGQAAMVRPGRQWPYRFLREKN